jgi:hypothetical protein
VSLVTKIADVVYENTGAEVDRAAADGAAKLIVIELRPELLEIQTKFKALYDIAPSQFSPQANRAIEELGEALGKII